jgi:Peptidase family M48
MRVNVYVPLLAALLLAWVAPYAASWLPPRRASRALACAALVVAGGWLGSLGLLTFAALARLPGVARASDWSVRRMRDADPVMVAVGALAVLVLAVCLAALATAAVRQIRDLRWAHRQARLLDGEGDVVVVDGPDPRAFAVPGAPGWIVVSRGMLDVLTEPERAALLAHERAHLAHGHHRFKAVWRLAAAACPPLRRMAAEGDFLLERWADEDAATYVGDRRTVAVAVARAALAGDGRTERAATLAATGGPVPRRVRALLSPAPRRRLTPLVAAGLLLALCCGSLADAVTDGREMVLSARYPRSPVCAAAAHPSFGHHADRRHCCHSQA